MCVQCVSCMCCVCALVCLFIVCVCCVCVAAAALPWGEALLEVWAPAQAEEWSVPEFHVYMVNGCTFWLKLLNIVLHSLGTEKVIWCIVLLICSWRERSRWSKRNDRNQLIYAPYKSSIYIPIVDGLLKCCVNKSEFCTLNSQLNSQRASHSIFHQNSLEERHEFSGEKQADWNEF